MKILSIGNSFSIDAHRYLSHLAEEADIDLTTANLYIGGCPLEKHFRNALGDVKAYAFDFNGAVVPGLLVSIKEALLFDSWDFVTLQQASHFSARFETYEPYLSELAAYVRKYCPKAKLLIHQTWAYEGGSERLKNVAKFETPEEMLENIVRSYDLAAKAIDAHGIIPSGEAMLEVTRRGIDKIHRDTFHADFHLGRALLAEVWLTAISGRDLREVELPRICGVQSEDDKRIIREVAYDVCKKYGWIKE